MQGAAQEASAAIADIAEAIANVDIIAAAVVQQGEATDEIARSILIASQGADYIAVSVKDVHKSTENTAGSVEDVGSVASELAQLSETLNRCIETFLSGMVQDSPRRAA